MINSQSYSDNLHWLSSELFMFNFEKCVQLNPDERLVALFLNIFKSWESAVSEWELTKGWLHCF